jgi:AraC-like DNA-binding protein
LHTKGEIRNVSGMTPRYTINQSMVKLSAQRPLNLEPKRLGRDSPAHDHDYYEICLVRTGRALHRTAHGRQTLQPGMVVVVAPRGVHEFTAPEDFSVINIYYLAEWLSAGWREQWAERGLVPLFLADLLFAPRAVDPVVFAVKPSEWNRVLRQVDELQTELTEHAPSPLLLKAGFLQLLGLLARARGGGCDFVGESTWTVMQEIEGCIEQGRAFSLASIARGASVSADRMSRLFKQVTGLSPLQYYQRRRVHHACSRLLDPGWTVTEVAMQLGYADASHFCRLFRKYAYLSPFAYRRKYQHG